MKFEAGRFGIEVFPETEVEKAYVEDTLGLKSGGDAIRLVRVNHFGASTLYCLSTDPYPYPKEITTKNHDGTWDIALDLSRNEQFRLQEDATWARMTVNEYIVECLEGILDEYKENKNG